MALGDLQHGKWEDISILISCHSLWLRQLGGLDLCPVDKWPKQKGSWGPPGSCRPQMGLMLAPWNLLSGNFPQWAGDSKLSLPCFFYANATGWILCGWKCPPLLYNHGVFWLVVICKELRNIMPLHFDVVMWYNRCTVTSVHDIETDILLIQSMPVYIHLYLPAL